jgi:hypothetical protein
MPTTAAAADPLDCRCTHPGELTRRVMTTHPASMNAGSAIDERRVVEPTIYQICVRGRVSERLGLALDGMRLEAGATQTAFTGQIRDQSQLYGLLDRVRDLGLELISVQPYPLFASLGDDEQATR